MDAVTRSRFQAEIMGAVMQHDQTLLSEIEARPELTPSIDKRLSEVIKAYLAQKSDQ